MGHTRDMLLQYTFEISTMSNAHTRTCREMMIAKSKRYMIIGPIIVIRFFLIFFSELLSQ